MILLIFLGRIKVYKEDGVMWFIEFRIDILYERYLKKGDV